MSQHSSLGWSEWEEDKLLPWLNTNRALSWDARAAAYHEQYGIKRTVESLRGKNYHILRKRRLNRAKLSRQRSVPKRQKRIRRLGGARKRFPAFTDTKARNIDQWLQRIPSAESTTSDNSSATERSHPVYTTPVPHHPQPQEFQSRSWLWDYVHRVCGTNGLRLHRE
ncbi:hypothetical protein N7481_008582 [Penicillium waksmanii]|uniref:uncharacterized protein n=1 Tax=Penicillium waksmanii TaxID=69791 RepID=UPI002546631C|nr:uncharacterized protein N7481_008582 [Penicillium waksmanii]KAJ5974875.1 hypothetical protein N7481_008582 [Penicillium waksmanii]